MGYSVRRLRHGRQVTAIIVVALHRLTPSSSLLSRTHTTHTITMTDVLCMLAHTTRSVDLYTWEHHDFSVVVAAGNDGDVTYNDDINFGDDYYDQFGKGEYTISSPGQAKNSITVGASELEHEGLPGAVNTQLAVLSSR